MKHGTYSNYVNSGCRCKSCTNAVRLYKRKYKADNPGHWKNHYMKMKMQLKTLKDNPCMDCGNTYPPECMDFDHRDPKDKSFNVSSSLARSWKTILKEAAKCDLVCANCHRIRTWGNKLNKHNH